MSSRLASAVLLVSLGSTVSAETESAMRAYVVSVDTAKKSITLKHTLPGGKEWKESVVTWDDSTEWARSEKQIWEETPATAELAKTLKKDAKVYVKVTDRGGAKLWLMKLRTIPPTEKVE